MKREKKFIIVIGRKTLFREKPNTEVLHTFICTDNRYSLISDDCIDKSYWYKLYASATVASRTCERLMRRVDEVAYCYIVDIKAISFVIGWWRENGKAVYTVKPNLFEEEVLRAGGVYRLYNENGAVENGER